MRQQEARPKIGRTICTSKGKFATFGIHPYTTSDLRVQYNAVQYSTMRNEGIVESIRNGGWHVRARNDFLAR